MTCLCGCGSPTIGKQKYHSQACQKRAWRAEKPKAEKLEEKPVEKLRPFRECRGCGGWGESSKLFICSECVRHGRAARGTPEADIPVLSFVLRDDPIRAVMVYYGLMNVYSRRTNDDITEIVCGVEEVKPVLRWMSTKLHGKVTSESGVFVALVPTVALVREASAQIGTKAERN